MSGKLYDLKHPAEFKAHGRVQVTQDGRPFYVFDNPKGFTFTLPAGTYNVSGATMVRRMKPRKGHKPTAELRFPLPKKVQIVWAPNPHKAVIGLVEGVIVLDPSLKSLPHFALVFILFHEIGHYFYQDEESCDRFAAEEMHRRGYNPSQINLATHMTLDHVGRKACNYANAKRLDR